MDDIDALLTLTLKDISHIFTLSWPCMYYQDFKLLRC